MNGTALDGDALQVWEAMNAVYRAFLAGDPVAADAHLHPDVTIWDSEHVPLVVGLGGLAALRASRPAAAGAGPRVEAIDARDPVVDVWDDVALLRHTLVVRLGAGHPDEVVRNTSVWRRVDGRWLAVHNHEDVLAR
jgi:hypothetical protein